MSQLLRVRFLFCFVAYLHSALFDLVLIKRCAGKSVKDCLLSMKDQINCFVACLYSGLL